MHLRAQIQALWPKGVDVYFDNVDGWQLEEALDSIAEGAPVVICGGISSYNNGARLASGPRNYLDTLLFRSARMEGFVATKFKQRFGEALEKLGACLAEGKIKSKEHVVQGGFQSAAGHILKLLRGDNFRKPVVHVVAE